MGLSLSDRQNSDIWGLWGRPTFLRKGAAELAAAVAQGSWAFVPLNLGPPTPKRIDPHSPQPTHSWQWTILTGPLHGPK